MKKIFMYFMTAALFLSLGCVTVDAGIFNRRKKADNGGSKSTTVTTVKAYQPHDVRYHWNQDGSPDTSVEGCYVLNYANATTCKFVANATPAPGAKPVDAMPSL